MGSLENGTDAEIPNCKIQVLQWVGQQHISLYRRCYSCNMQHTLYPSNVMIQYISNYFDLCKGVIFLVMVI